MTSANNHYDVIVVGGGAAGEHAAGALAEGGLRVAIVERELVGGECSYWACIPSKSLLRPGEAVHSALEVGAKVQVDVKVALAWRDFMVSGYSDAGQEPLDPFGDLLAPCWRPSHLASHWPWRRGPAHQSPTRLHIPTRG